MFRAAVVTPWMSSGIFRDPKLSDDYDVGGVEDITGQGAEQVVPAPNEYTVEIVCDQATLDAIEADPTYEVLWSEQIPEDF